MLILLPKTTNEEMKLNSYASVNKYSQSIVYLYNNLGLLPLYLKIQQAFDLGRGKVSVGIRCHILWQKELFGVDSSYNC